MPTNAIRSTCAALLARFLLLVACATLGAGCGRNSEHSETPQREPDTRSEQIDERRRAQEVATDQPGPTPSSIENVVFEAQSTADLHRRFDDVATASTVKALFTLDATYEIFPTQRVLTARPTVENYSHTEGQIPTIQPGIWKRSYTSEGQPDTSWRDPDAPILNEMTHGVFNVYHLVFAKPGVDLDVGTEWQGFLWLSRGLTPARFFITSLQDDKVTLTATTGETSGNTGHRLVGRLQATYDRATLLADTVVVTESFSTDALLNRNGERIPLSLERQSEYTVRRVK